MTIRIGRKTAKLLRNEGIYGVEEDLKNVIDYPDDEFLKREIERIIIAHGGKNILKKYDIEFNSKSSKCLYLTDLYTNKRGKKSS